MSSAVAIVGIGCRFPGGVTEPERFWALLREGRCVVGDITPDRMDLERWLDPERPEKIRNHPTADALADHLLKLLVAEPGAGPEPAVPAAARAPKDRRAREEVAAHSGAEAEAALLAELESGGAR
jgi:hypothetical protein